MYSVSVWTCMVVWCRHHFSLNWLFRFLMTQPLRKAELITVCKCLPLLVICHRLHRTGGDDWNWSSVQRVSRNSLQSGFSNFRAQCSVQRGQQETGQEHLTVSHSTVTLLSAQACAEVHWMASTQVNSLSPYMDFILWLIIFFHVIVIKQLKLGNGKIVLCLGFS